LEDGSQKEVLEVLLTKSHSGGKFDNSSYAYSSGLNGLGITITNALSKYIRITSHRDGKYVKAYAESSMDVDLEYGKSAERRGTEVEFCPDEKYFHTKVVPLDFLVERCKTATALGFRGRLIVNGTEVKTDASIYDLIKEETNIHDFEPTYLRSGV
jgi:DNA gyrase/topoisomerase IV subunit B